MDHPEDFAPEAFFDQNSLQQIQHIDPATDLGSVPNVSLPPNLAVIEQLHRRWYSGCLDRVAWSRLGHLASISEDGCTVYLECLLYEHDAKTWRLNERHALTTIFEDAVSLAWSSTGAELAVVDIKGRVWVYTASHVAINRLVLSRRGDLDEPGESSQPIGMTWLNQDRQDRPKNVVVLAAKNDSRWVHTNARAKPLGPYWPRAVVVVHRSGLLTLCFQRADGQYSRINTHLSPHDNTLYTHASFAPTVEGKLLIALHSFKHQISVRFLSIDWTGVRQSPGTLPVLTVDFVSAKVASQPTGSATLGDVYDPDSWRLTHVEVVPTSDVEKAVQTPPTILAVASGINRGVNITDHGYLVSSMIKRWTVTLVEQKLHPLFDQLPSKGTNKTTSPPVYTFQRQPDKEEQIVTRVHPMEGHAALVVTTQEGRTDFLNPEDLSPVSYAASVTETSSLAQAGFIFPFVPNAPFPAFSPSACIRADITPEGKTQIVTMEHTLDHGQQAQQPLDPNIDVAIAALNLSFARACWTNATIDDILMCALHNIPASSRPLIVSSMYRALFRDNEFVSERTQGSELERVFHKQVMGRVMAYHAGLTAYCPQLPTIAPTEGRSGWSLSAQWAWMANNIRHTATLLFMNLRDVQNLNLVMTQDFTDMLCSNLRWGLSVVRFIISTILEVGDRETNPDMFDSKDIGRVGDTKGDGSQGLVALLLNIHCSRQFLVAFVRAVRAYAKSTEPKSQHHVQVLQCIQQQTVNKGITFPAVEALLEARWPSPGDIEGDIPGTAVRQLDMMATGTVHPAYEGTIKLILNKLLNSPAGLRAKNLIDRLKLYTDHVDLDYVFLNRHVLGHLEAQPKETPVIYDVHRKRPILKGGPDPSGTGVLMVRRCVRCGSFSEDINVALKEWPKQVGGLLARCVCDGQWVLEPWKGDGE
ncbi:Mediator of RNA polymerase II transcription subunit 16 [Exophiala dermatitidis]